MYQDKFLLSICIPTYNRDSDLKKNLYMIESFIKELNLQNKVSLSVSNNASTDDTATVIESFAKQTTITFKYFTQKKNIGFEKNFILLGEHQTSKYIMTLGDDDYINANYLATIVEILEKKSNISCIIPNYHAITPSGDFLFSRDPKSKTTLFKKGFDSCYNNAWKAHQLSGLVFKLDTVFEEYKNRGIHNLYPQIFCIAYSTLIGDCLYLVDFPIRVTDVPQSQKDWDYGKDGLMIDNFDNFINLDLTSIQIAKLEILTLKKSIYGIIGHNNLYEILRAIIIIILNPKTVIYTKLFCLYYFPYKLIRKYLLLIKHIIK